MKKAFLSLLSFMLCSSLLLAQVPQKFNYQAVARTSSGATLNNTAISVRLTIRNISSSGAILYRETHNVSTNPFGLFTAAIGGGTVVSGSFSGISWGTGDKYLQVEYDPSGGTAFLDMGTTQLLSVPFAQYAASAGGSSYTSGTGINIAGNVISNTGDTDPANDITNTTTAGGDLNGTYPNPGVVKIQGRNIASTTPSTGQALAWDGSNWAPTTISGGGSFSAGTGISIVGTTISNTGDTDASNDITNTTTAGGDLSGTYPNPNVVKIQGRSIATSVPTSGQTLTWDGSLWTPVTPTGSGLFTAGTGISILGATITNSGDTDASNDITNTTTAGGDLNGTYPNPNVVKIQGYTVSNTAPSNGQVLTYNSSASRWEPTTPSGGGGSYSAGTGLQLSGSTFSLTNTGVAASTYGAANGIYPVITVDAQGRITSASTQNISASLLPTGTSGQTLRHNGTSYISNSEIYNDGNRVGINTTAPRYELDVLSGDTAVIRGFNTSTFTSYGVVGVAQSTGSLGSGVYGISTATTGRVSGVFGEATSTTNQACGVFGLSRAATGFVIGVQGEAVSSTVNASGMFGFFSGASGAGNGVYGLGSSRDATGVYGYASSTGGANIGVLAIAAGDTGSALYAIDNRAGTAGPHFAGVFEGNVIATGTFTPSDERVKQNITNFTGGLNIVMSLATKSYEFKDYSSKNIHLFPEGQQVGVMAQDIEKALPGLVREAIVSNKGYIKTHQDENVEPYMESVKVVNYTGLIPVLLNAIQEQQAQIEMLKKEISTLKK